MEHHQFTWVSAIPGLNSLPPHVATSLIVFAVIVFFVLRANRQEATAVDSAVPDDSLTFRNIAELLVEGLLRIAEGILGPHARRYVPLYGTFFLFILVANLIGLIPGFSPPTTNFNVTFALGLLSFLAYNYVGFKEQGVGYLQHFVGPLIWLAPLMIPQELITNFMRPFSLALRLLGNMTGDHTVLEIFTALTKIGVPVIFYGLATFVCVVQAFVFTILSMVYVSLAITYEGEHH